MNGFSATYVGTSTPGARNSPEILGLTKVLDFWWVQRRKRRSRDTFIQKFSTGIDGNLFIVSSSQSYQSRPFIYPLPLKLGGYKRNIIPVLIQMTWKSARIYFLVFYIIITVFKCMVSVSVSHHASFFPSLQLCPVAQSHDLWPECLFKPVSWESHQPKSSSGKFSTLFTDKETSWSG